MTTTPTHICAFCLDQVPVRDLTTVYATYASWEGICKRCLALEPKTQPTIADMVITIS